MVRRLFPAALFAALAVSTALGCQYLPYAGPDGQLAMRVEWPFRTQAIPADTAAVAVAVFKDGNLVPAPSGRRLTIIGRGAGSALYPGLNSGSYRVVAVAYDKSVAPTAGGNTAASITLGTRTQVTIDLNASGAGNAGDLSPYVSEVESYIKSQLQPSPSPSPTATSTPGATALPTTDPLPTAPTATPATSVPTPTTSSGSTSGGGGGGGGTTTPSGITFTGGF